MKSTGKLNVYGDFSMDRSKIVIHPNDGFDIGFMTLDNPIEMFHGVKVGDFESGAGTGEQGTLNLANDCRMGTVILNLKYWEEMGKPPQVSLYADDKRILISHE